MRNVYLPLIVSLACMLSACAHAVREAPAKSGSAQFKVFIPPGALGFNLPKNKAVWLGPALEQAEPVYPSQMIAKDIPEQSVCLSVAINVDGRAYAATPLYAMPGCPDNAQAVDPAFIAAARKAALAWRFLPALLCTFKPGVDASAPERTCPEDDATSQPIAISLAFVFTFSQRHGQPRVRSGRLPTHP